MPPLNQNIFYRCESRAFRNLQSIFKSQIENKSKRRNNSNVFENSEYSRREDNNQILSIEKEQSFDSLLCMNFFNDKTFEMNQLINFIKFEQLTESLKNKSDLNLNSSLDSKNLESEFSSITIQMKRKKKNSVLI